MSFAERVQPSAVFARGRRISLVEVRGLIAHLEGEPSDWETRLTVLSFAIHRAPSAELLGVRALEHHLWFVQNEPGHELHTLLPIALGPLDETCEESKIRDAWLASVARSPDDIRILENAASYLTLCDFEHAKSILERCERLDETNAEWPHLIGWVCELHAGKGPERDLDRSLESLNAYRRALAKSVEPEFRLNSLYNVAVASLWCGQFEAARSLSADLIDGADRALFGRESRYAKFIAHTILGLLAIAREDDDEAERELLVSARFECDILCGSSSNPWDLAGEVLKCDRSAAVLEFLELRAENIGRLRVDGWIAQIQSGKRTDVFSIPFPW